MKFASICAVLALCLLICALAGCEAAPDAKIALAPAAPAAFSDLSLGAPLIEEAPATIPAIDIIMDTTDSMAGFAQSPALDAAVGTAFTRSVNKLIYAAKVAVQSGEVGFFRTDAELLPLSEALFRDLDAPAFYIPRRWYTARGWQDVLDRHANGGFYERPNIERAAAQADADRLTVIITDLFENGETNEALISLIKGKYMGGAQSAALIPIRSEFDGYVYDVFETGDTSARFYHGLAKTNDAPTFADIGRWEAAVRGQGQDAHVEMASLALTRLEGPAKRRPFYLLLLGERAQVNAFAEDYVRLLREMEGEPIEVGAPILTFDEPSPSQLTGTQGAGGVVRASTDLPAQALDYARYQDLSASYQGETVAASEMAANHFACLYRGEAGAAITLTAEMALLGTAPDAQGLALLEALFAGHELRATVSVAKAADAAKMILTEFGEERNYAYYDFADWSPSEAVRGALIQVEQGAFAADAQGLRAVAEARVTIDPSALPAGAGIYRFQIDWTLHRVGALRARAPSVDDYPWAAAWNLSLAGQSAEAWLADAALRTLDGTINLTSFTQALINARGHDAPAAQEDWPAALAVNRAFLDLIVKK